MFKSLYKWPNVYEFLFVFSMMSWLGDFFFHFLEAFIYLTLFFYYYYICMCIKQISLFSHMSVGDKPQSLDEKPHQHHKPHALRGLERGGLCRLLRAYYNHPKFLLKNKKTRNILQRNVGIGLIIRILGLGRKKISKSMHIFAYFQISLYPDENVIMCECKWLISLSEV